MNLLILTDGKKGHENQSLGLAEAILRRTKEGTLEVLPSSSHLKSLPTRPPHLIIAAGHATHLRLLWLSSRYRCPSIVIMKPSLPTFLFTYCLIPEHDLKNLENTANNIIPIKGALNRLPEVIPEKQPQGLIMLGGPSKHFDWQLPPLLPAIVEIVTSAPELSWTLGDSRRTPPDTLSAITELGLPITLAPHQEASGDWLTQQLLNAQVAWITPDSTSMLFEALTAGCQLGTLPLTANHTRLSQAHDKLISQGWITPFQTPSTIPLPQPKLLHETARCAELILQRLTETSKNK